MAETLKETAQAEEVTIDPALVTDPGSTDLVAQMAEAPVVEQVSAGNLAILKASIAPGLNDAEINHLLMLSKAIGLNPFAREIWAAKGRGDSAKLLIMVGRDGLLRKAEEFPDYMGYDSGVVHENDDFWKADPDPDSKTMRGRAGITHRHGPPKSRGAVIGAWAVAERRGRPVRYFYADLAEYMPGGDRFSPWKKQLSVMIEKVPISVVHRTLINLSGVYLQEEADAALAPGSPREVEAPLDPEAEASAIDALIMGLEAPLEFRRNLAQTIREINVLSPNAWGLGACQMKLSGQPSQVLKRQLFDAQCDLAELKGEDRSTVTREDARPSGDDAPVMDAQVVPPDEDAPRVG
jgi:hypothetical protein